MPQFKKGHKKIGGRKKGTPNKFNSNLHAICAARGLNPFEALLAMADNKNTDPGHKLGALKELCEYLYPKRRRVEFEDDFLTGIAREIEALTRLPTKELKRLAQEEMNKIQEEQEPDLDDESE